MQRDYIAVQEYIYFLDKYILKLSNVSIQNGFSRLYYKILIMQNFEDKLLSRMIMLLIIRVAVRVLMLNKFLFWVIKSTIFMFLMFYIFMAVFMWMWMTIRFYSGFYGIQILG